MPDAPEIPEARDPLQRVALTLAILAICLSFLRISAITRRPPPFSNQRGVRPMELFPGKEHQGLRPRCMETSSCGFRPTSARKTRETSGPAGKDAQRYDVEKAQSKRGGVVGGASQHFRPQRRCDKPLCCIRSRDRLLGRDTGSVAQILVARVAAGSRRIIGGATAIFCRLSSSI